MSIDFQWAHWLLNHWFVFKVNKKSKNIVTLIFLYIFPPFDTQTSFDILRCANFHFGNIRFYRHATIIFHRIFVYWLRNEKKIFTRKVPTSGLRKVLAFRCGCFYFCEIVQSSVFWVAFVSSLLLYRLQSITITIALRFFGIIA